MVVRPTVTRDSSDPSRIIVQPENGEAFRFSPSAESFRGGVDVTVVDTSGDGKADILVGADPAVGVAVRPVNGSATAESQGFLAFDPGFRGGVAVASGNVDTSESGIVNASDVHLLGF